MRNEQLIEQTAAFKKEARPLFEGAVAALIALGFRYPGLGANFLWDATPELDAECNKILRDLSDSLAAKAKARAISLMEAEGWDGGEDAWAEANENVDVPILTRFDQQGSFLRSLMEIWIALAFVNGITPSYLKILVINHLSNPYTSKFWRGLPAGLLKRGPGYQRDILDQIGLIGQDGIIGAVRLGEWMNARDEGATYYIRRRGSFYRCDECQELANKPIPIEVPFDFLHARCMCWPEYHYEPIEV